jgi:hypothetical protein
MASAKVDTVKRSQALLDAVCPLDAPCQYQAPGPKSSPSQFIICDSTFDSARARGEHMRQHERYMTKKDSNGAKVPTCFFGNCATDSGNGRDGPDFDTEDDRLAHVWSHHHVTTMKTPYVKFCEYCDKWLIEPYEWLTHARIHVQDAEAIVTEVGYSGVHYGRNIVPRICPFCFHDDQLPAHKRLDTYTREGHPKHMNKHLPREGDANEMCPCYPATCTKTEEMDGVELVKHLDETHGVKFLSSIRSQREKS